MFFERVFKLVNKLEANKSSNSLLYILLHEIQRDKKLQSSEARTLALLDVMIDQIPWPSSVNLDSGWQAVINCIEDEFKRFLNIEYKSAFETTAVKRVEATDFAMKERLTSFKSLYSTQLNMVVKDLQPNPTWCHSSLTCLDRDINSMIQDAPVEPPLSRNLSNDLTRMFWIQFHGDASLFEADNPDEQGIQQLARLVQQDDGSMIKDPGNIVAPNLDRRLRAILQYACPQMGQTYCARGPLLGLMQIQKDPLFNPTYKNVCNRIILFKDNPHKALFHVEVHIPCLMQGDDEWQISDGTTPLFACRYDIIIESTDQGQHYDVRLDFKYRDHTPQQWFSKRIRAAEKAEQPSFIARLFTHDGPAKQPAAAKNAERRPFIAKLFRKNGPSKQPAAAAAAAAAEQHAGSQPSNQVPAAPGQSHNKSA